MDTPDSSLGIQKLQEQLTCPVCFDPYYNPKTLPCLHSFCFKCIQQLSVDLDKNQISCPTCRKTATLPYNGVEGLPSAFVINSLLEIQELLKQVNVSEGQQICCDNCQLTNASRYCKQCATVYCEECLVFHNKLKVNISHQITDINDVASNVYSMKQGVTMNCTNHNKPLEIFCETCGFLICRDCIIRHHRDHEYDIISDMFFRHRQEIRSSLQLVKQKIEATNGVLMALIKREKEVAQQGDVTRKEIHLYAQQIIESVQQYEKLLIEQVDSSVQHKLKLLGEQVKEAETALVQLKSCEKYIEQGLEVGSPQQILLEKQRMVQGMETACKQINPEAFQPVEEANIVFARNKAVADSCKDIGEVKCSFSYSGKPRQVISGFYNPLSIAVNSEGVMVIGSEGSNCITVVGRDGGIVRSFGLDGRENGQYAECLAVAFADDGHILANSVRDHTVYKLTLQGQHIASVGGKGSGPLEFNYPNAIAVHPSTSQIYVVDEENHRIQVINDDFTYSHSIGSEDMAAGRPCGVALDSAGNVYVCNAGNTSVDVFTSDGAFVHRFGSKGSGDGQLGYIVSIAVDSHNLVYVADGGNQRISIFTAEGEFFKSIKTKGTLDYLCGIATDTQGQLYAFDEKKIAIF